MKSVKSTYYVLVIVKQAIMKVLLLSLVLMAMLFYSITPTQASRVIMTKEIRLAAETGQYIQILEDHEQHLLDPLVQSYFKPFTIEEEALQFADIVQEELKRYLVNVLQQLNIYFYLVKASANMAGLTFSSKEKANCSIYLAQAEDLSIQQVRQTIHHEIFHCYDQEQSIDRWQQRFEPASHITDLWGTMTDQLITINYAGEERAEYFASIVTGNNSKLENDPFYEIKQQVLLSDLHILIHDKTSFPSLRTFFIRSWQDGRISYIQEVTANSLLMRTYEFDFRSSSCIITNYLTNVRTVLSLQ